MKISMQSVINKPSPCKNQQKQVNSADLKSALENVLKQKNEYNTAQINWVDEETVELDNVSNQSLYSFLLEAEKQGKDICFTKQTVITIS